jgi:hypothetical protein
VENLGLFLHEYSEIPLQSEKIGHEYQTHHQPGGKLAQMWGESKFDLSGYEYILLTLDDVRFGRSGKDGERVLNSVKAPFSIKSMIRILEKCNVDVVSPIVHNANNSTNFCQHDDVVATIGGSLEYFTYLMKPSTYTKFIEVIGDNYFMWGVDRYMERCGLKTAVDCTSHCHHMIRMPHLKNFMIGVERYNMMNRWYKKNGFPGMKHYSWRKIIYRGKILSAWYTTGMAGSKTKVYVTNKIWECLINDPNGDRIVIPWGLRFPSDIIVRYGKHRYEVASRRCGNDIEIILDTSTSERNST